MTTSQRVFPGVPFVESPLFDQDLDGAGFAPHEREAAVSLNRKGFAVIDFPDPEILERIDRIKARLSPTFGLSPQEEGEAARPSVGRIQDAWKDNADVLAIAANPGILDLLSRLYGRRAFPFQTLNFPVGTEQALHTDSVHFSCIPERFMCGVWLAMEDVSPEAGALTYVPGSHRWPIMSNLMIGRRGWQTDLQSAQDPFAEAWQALIAASDARSEIFEAKKGQALIWCANLLHGGSPRVDPQRTRWSQVTHYYFDDCIYYTPAFSDEPVGKLRLRNIIDASDGRLIRNQYLGEPIAEGIPPAPAPARPSWVRKARKVWKTIRPF